MEIVVIKEMGFYYLIIKKGLLFQIPIEKQTLFLIRQPYFNLN